MRWPLRLRLNLSMLAAALCNAARALERSLAPRELSLEDGSELQVLKFSRVR